MAAIYGNPAVAPSAVVTNTKESGPGSLRTALYYAADRSTDAVPTPTSILFHIPTSDPNYSAGTGVFTIKPTGQMVAPGAGTTIDGSTQTAFTGDTNPAGPEILLDGSLIASQGLVNPASGLVLREMNCTVRNLIINGFNQRGILLDGTRAALYGTSASGNVITGCYIGTDRTGNMAVPNTFPGIQLLGGAHDNTIGGTIASARNVLSGNAEDGILILGAGTNNNLVIGNYIGLTASGGGALANAHIGVQIFNGAQGNIIGGLTSGARNVISGNKRQGIIVAGSGTSGNLVLGNYIGLNAGGIFSIPNGNENFATHSFYPGVAIFSGAQNNIIGGTVAGSANVISGNTGQGILISGSGTTGNLVQGNFIGTNTTGAGAIGNGFADPPNNYRYAGITIFSGAQSNTIGGTAAGAGNVISGNGAHGVLIFNSGTNANVVQGNLIGTNATGTGPVPNFYEGVTLSDGAQNNLVGGTVAGARNILSGNSTRGVGIFDAATMNNMVQGNYIGLNAAGTGALANTFSGIEIFLASNNTIGGTNGGARNFISGNGDRGVLIDGANASGNLVQGNTIGLDINGTARANGNTGVTLNTGAHANTIGGTASGTSNIIAGNTQQGIALTDSTTIQNAIRQNSIFTNSAKGIARNGTSNNSQPFPSLTSVALSTAMNPSGTDVSGTFTGGSGTIEFFASPTGDPSGFGEGQYLAGSIPAGAAFTAHLTSVVPAGYVIAATATDTSGNSSEFSGTISVPAPSDNGSDGLPDEWMNFYFQHIDPRAIDLSRATDDADDDGMTNLQEFRAGTDPTSAASWLHFTAIARNGSDRVLTLASVAGKTYRMDYKDDLPSATWILLADQVFATATSTQFTDSGAGTLAHRFYRASIEP